MNKKNNLLVNLLTEASAYTSMDAIEALVQEGMDLSQIPVQPIYLALKSLPMDRACTILPRLSKTQRQACLDLDLWVKDNVDTEEFGYWIQSYSLCEDESVRLEFIGGPEFFLYLKSRFNVWTFDVEDPEYPDHDDYFLTDDNLLLFEFDKDFPYVNEIQRFVRELYGQRGVEGAYTYLFKMVSESFMQLMEGEYQEKKERLRDLGFVDYFDSLIMENTFSNMSLLENFIKKKKPVTAKLDSSIASQNLHRSAISPFNDKLDSLSDELSKITNIDRSKFLQFSFVRLVNSTLSFGHALREGPIAMSRIGSKTRFILELGFDYLYTEAFSQKLYKLEEGINFFDLFDFKDLYQVGNSLLSIAQKPAKSALSKFSIEELKEAFLGPILNDLIDNAYSVPVKSSVLFNEKYEEVTSFHKYQNLEESLKFVIQITPFSNGLFNQIKELEKEGKIRDEFYLNYQLVDIDFECLLLTSLANFKLGHLETDDKKLGLTPKEYIKFASLFTDGEDLLPEKDLIASLDEFIKKFGLERVDAISAYLCKLLEQHISGYDFKNLPEGDFKHVGGPILLNLN